MSKVVLISNRLIFSFMHLFAHTSIRRAEVRKTVAIAWDSDKLENCRWRRSPADRSGTPPLKVVRSAAGSLDRSRCTGYSWVLLLELSDGGGVSQGGVDGEV